MHEKIIGNYEFLMKFISKTIELNKNNTINKYEIFGYDFTLYNKIIID